MFSSTHTFLIIVDQSLNCVCQLYLETLIASLSLLLEVLTFECIDINCGLSIYHRISFYFYRLASTVILYDKKNRIVIKNEVLFGRMKRICTIIFEIHNIILCHNCSSCRVKGADGVEC